MADLVEIGAVWVRVLACLPGLLPEPTHIVDQVLPLIVLNGGLLVRRHEPVNGGAVCANGLGVFAHCREVVEVLLHGVGDRGLARLRCRPLRDERCSHADAEFVLALALAVQSLVQVLAGRIVLGEELKLAADPQAVVVALAALPWIAYFHALERSPRLAA